MTIAIEEVQAALAVLPEHILHIDLLVFRRHELEIPTPWLELGRTAPVLLEAIRALRDARLDSRSGSWREVAVSAGWDPPVLDLGAERLDRIRVETLVAVQRRAADAAADRPSCRDPAREQLAALVEERLQDILLEIAHGIRRQRRLPRLPPERNPLVRHLPLARRALHVEVANLFEAVARQIGPLPALTRAS